jgi:SAM-dependent methyltransferase
VFPIHSDARQLPYADGFFDAIVSMDSYHYYGTDDLYLRYFTRFVKPGGRIGIVVPGLMRDFEGVVPAHLAKRQPSGAQFWDPAECFSIHTRDWWRRHWKQTGLVDIEVADTLPDGWRHWLLFEKLKVALGVNRSDDEVEALEVDGGEYLGFVRLVARTRT